MTAQNLRVPEDCERGCVHHAAGGALDEACRDHGDNEIPYGSSRRRAIAPPPPDTIPESERITLRPDADDEHDFWPTGGAT